MSIRNSRKLKNITLSADANLIASARRRAHQEGVTLNDKFRAWLEQFTNNLTSREEFDDLMNSMEGVLGGSKFSREEANER